jgi:hypothetical protein
MWQAIEPLPLPLAVERCGYLRLLAVTVQASTSSVPFLMALGVGGLGQESFSPRAGYMSLYAAPSTAEMTGSLAHISSREMAS